jgi:mRNA interferase MazF
VVTPIRQTRPGLVAQSDLFNTHHPSITVCPISSELIDASLFRLVVDPAETNGLKKRSQIMIDKIQTVPREKLSKKVGHLSASEMETINQALAR